MTASVHRLFDDAPDPDVTQEQFTAYVTILCEKQAATDAANSAEGRD